MGYLRDHRRPGGTGNTGSIDPLDPEGGPDASVSLWGVSGVTEKGDDPRFSPLEGPACSELQ